MKDEWAEEFRSFTDADERKPPRAITERILSAVHADLNPAGWRVFSKLALVHLFTGALTLLVCPQFGIGLFPSMGLMGLFMNYGEVACSVGCGAFFLGSSLLVASLLLRAEEVRVLRRNRLLQLSVLGLLSSAVFACAGAEFVAGLFAAWLAGSVIGGLATLELGWRLRARFIN